MLMLEDGQVGEFAAVTRCEIDVHLQQDCARVRSTLTFGTNTAVERPLFSLIGVATAITHEGEQLELLNTVGSTSHTVWGIAATLPPGAQVVVESRLVGVFRPRPDGVLWCSQTNDGDSDPHYLDRVAASGFEHDSYPVTLAIHGVPAGHELFANGVVQNDGDVWRVAFPSWYSPSCPWWVLAPPSLARRRVSFDIPWKSEDGGAGTELQGLFLSDDADQLDVAIDRSRTWLRSLYERFGAWPHPAVQVYLTETQNMEYAGATCTSLSSLEHELAHSYFGRCVLPNDGAAGWIDEGVVTWIETNPPVSGIGDLPESSCGRAQPWRRGGSRAGYFAGASLMGLTERKLEGTERSTDGFLREVLRRFRWKQISTPEFLELLEAYAGDWVAEAAARSILADPP